MNFLGLDVRLESTDSVLGLHQRIAVYLSAGDSLQINGIDIGNFFGISFGMERDADGKFPAQDPCENARAEEPSFGGVGTGTVYLDLDPARRILNTFKTSQSEVDPISWTGWRRF